TFTIDSGSRATTVTYASNPSSNTWTRSFTAAAECSDAPAASCSLASESDAPYGLVTTASAPTTSHDALSPAVRALSFATATTATSALPVTTAATAARGAST